MEGKTKSDQRASNSAAKDLINKIRMEIALVWDAQIKEEYASISQLNKEIASKEKAGAPRAIIRRKQEAIDTIEKRIEVIVHKRRRAYELIDDIQAFESTSLVQV